jgi:hypothetical protein
MPRGRVRFLRACSLVPLVVVSLGMSAATTGVRFPRGELTSSHTRVCATRSAGDLRLSVERFEIVAWDAFHTEAGSVIMFGTWQPVVDVSLWPWFIGALALPVLCGAIRINAAHRPGGFAVGAPVRQLPLGQSSLKPK